MKIKKVCQQCGKEISPIIPGSGKYQYSPRQWENRKYCSLQCSALVRKTRKTLSCKMCGKKIEKEPNQVNKSKNSFCSRKCSAKYNAPLLMRRIKGKSWEEIYGKEKAKINRIKMSTRMLADWKIGIFKYIPPPQFGNKYKMGIPPYNKNQPYNTQPNWKGRSNPFICPTCGISIRKPGKEKSKYCSRECFSIHRGLGYAKIMNTETFGRYCKAKKIQYQLRRSLNV